MKKYNFTVLYVEDEADIAYEMKHLLSKKVKEVYLAHDGTEALKLYLEKRPNIIITDIRLPKISGLEIIREIRKKDFSIPVIILSAHNDFEYLKESILLNITNYLVKPIDIEELYQSIDKAKEIVGIKKQNQKLIDNITKEKEKYKQLTIKLHKILDTQDNMVLLTDGKNVEYGNKRFLEFFQVDSFEEFEMIHGAIYDKFVENDRYFHLKKIKNGVFWIDAIKTLPKEQKIVALLDGRFNVHIYAINITDFSDKSYLISLHDISGTMIKTLELEDKVIHDKLTGAYNREFFETHIYTIITNPAYESVFTALAYIDIDHFKSINDTYGHDVGDIVLKDLVRVIKDFSRVDDILVRFGGEEFLLILQVKSLESASRALEHFRHVIEFHKFKGLDKTITCSFGVTLYRDNEEITETLKRADTALYKAKNNGRNKVVSE